ncbi:MAG: aminoacetone oxidase family FAD-binding enzyme [Shackletoniella antarctica]|uniref:Aminoacetone oxidase family FAD-binding enzyme n=1 Tax=Shackletoniella antarctica TaxID=268115 RepID=A0A2W4Y3J3_9CYAN|nr:MAG: aminoacetone oxidase family FAD-binding enzyme [Shackletoniella antarctica]
MSHDASVIVVGAGAAGLFGAIACAEAYPAATIHIFEAGREALAKVRISGGGRCNVTHACFDPAVLVGHYPRGDRALRGPFSRFQPRDTVQWFEQRGVDLKTEADGRMFPTTDDSGTIVDCLLGEARRLGIKIHTGCAIAQAKPHDDGFDLTTRTGEDWRCQKLLLATGSSPGGYRLALSLGHDLVPPVPSLFTFNIPDPALRELAGVSVEAVHLSLALDDAPALTQSGPLLVTHWGMSGPAVLKLSAYGAVGLHHQRYRATLSVNWLPALKPDQVRQKLLALKQDQGKRQVAAFSPFPALSRRLWQYLVQHRVNLRTDLNWADLSKAQLQALVSELTRGDYAVAGKGVFKDEFVTCGGLPLPEVNFKTLESRCRPGLYLAGELLNIDGVTGGFNFQNAWTTGWLAGQAMAAALASAD